MEAYLEMEFTPTVAEFFAGIGLMRIGLERAGWKTLYANDIDKSKERIYKNHFQKDADDFHLGDIHTLSEDEIPVVSLATASFPCTDLSLAGKREGLAGKHSSAFWGFIRLLKEMGNRRPPLVLLENVEGFLTSNKGQDFKDALLALNGLGYAVDAFLIDASSFVPQSRVRLFIIGKYSYNTDNLANDKQLLFFQSETRNQKLANFILQNPEINWDIKNLPKLPIRQKSLKDIVEEIPDDSDNWWSKDRVEYLINQTSPKHKQTLEIAKSQGFLSYFTAFRRSRNGRSMAEVRSDGIAGCLRTPKGGSARQILIQAGKDEIKVRFISPLECARLMGVDDYKISGSLNESLFGFGDAVCVPVVTWIAENYLNPLLEEINSKNIESQYGYKSSARGI